MLSWRSTFLVFVSSAQFIYYADQFFALLIAVLAPCFVAIDRAVVYYHALIKQLYPFIAPTKSQLSYIRMCLDR